MSNDEAFQSYILAEVRALAPLEFVALVPSGRPLDAVQVGRGEEGEYIVAVPGRPPITPELPLEIRSKLRELDFASQDPSQRTFPWLKIVQSAEMGVTLGRQLLGEVFAVEPGSALDVVHGSRKLEFEARKKLATVRSRIQGLLSDFVETPIVEDDDGDFLLDIGDVRVTVAPRAAPNGPVIVRVFAVTNVSINVTPELGILLARLNFGLMFGRFALDTDHSAIWFDDTLLGEHFSDEELRFAIDVVSRTADDWDDRLKQMFGGMTYQEVLKASGSGSTPPVKPGEGIGMYL